MGPDYDNDDNAKLLVHSWWSDFKMEAYMVRENAMITIKNATSKSVLLTATNGFYSADVNLTVTGLGGGPDNHKTGSSNTWIWIIVFIVAVLAVVAIVVGVKKFGGDDEETA